MAQGSKFCHRISSGEAISRNYGDEDAKKKKLIWEAVAVDRVREETLRNLEQVVMEAVPRFFATYPFRAGEAAPIYSQQ